MDQIVLDGDPPVTVSLRRSGRARRLSLRVSQLDGQVTLTLPKGVRDQMAVEFAHEKADWLRKHLAKQEGPILIAEGQRIAVEGRARLIVAGSGRKVILSEDEISVPGPPARFPARVAGFLKVLARERLEQASDQYAEALGRSYGRLSIRDTRSRWGSCSSEGNLMYSWRLILAPPEVLRYVAAHEVAHLAEMNHSARFWAEVERLYPGYSAPRKWLRQHGTGLHRYRFGD